MSSRPCDVCGQTVPGALDNVYLKLLDGPDRYRRKLALCRPHLEELLAQHAKDWLFVHPIYGETISEACHSCGTLLSAGLAYDRFFADVYARGYERATYAATYCLSCAGTIRVKLDMELFEPVDRPSGPGGARGLRVRYGREYRPEQREGRVVDLGRGRRQDDPQRADGHDQQKHVAEG